MIKVIYSTILFVVCVFNLSAFSYAAPNCSQAKISEVLGGSGSTVNLDCNLSLSATDIVRKKILITKNFSAERLTLNCNGALIDLGKKRAITIYKSSSGEIPKNITVKNCRIKGNIRIYGLGSNGEASALRRPSYNPGYIDWLQENAPSDILFDNITLNSAKGNTFYLSPGVNHVTVKNSVIKNSDNDLAVYLDAGSSHNTFINNKISVSGSTGREVMAIDSSAYNIIKNNTFGGLNRGGIYLYRNCGEGGVVRHQTPSNNVIESNYFIYRKYNGLKPAIWVSSRNGQRGYCGDDRLYWPLPQNTSSTDDRDNASGNKIRYNQFLNRDPQNYIRYGTAINGNPNDLTLNRPHSYGNIKVPSFRYNAVPSEHNFECRVNSNNSGCYKVLSCPLGKVNASIRAACNLEYGAVSASHFPNWGELRVVRQSDPASYFRSACTVNQTSIKSGKTYIGGSSNAITFIGCKEFDNNGGDCHIKGQQICY